MNVLMILQVGIALAGAPPETACDGPCLAQAARGEKPALQRAFEALRNADGHVAEDLSAALGKSVRANARAYLQTLKEFGTKIRAHGTVDFLGEDFVDRIDLQKRELQARLKALEKVKHHALKKTRPESISVLKAAIEKLEKTGQP